MKTINICRLFTLGVVMFFVSSCTDYLSVKPDKRLASPRNAGDLQAMLNNVSEMNYALPTGVGVIGSDDMFLTDAIWNSRAAQFKMEYNWDLQPLYQLYWTNPYRGVLNANVVLDELDNIESVDLNEKREIKGAAIFYRAYLHYHVAQIFAPPFHESNFDAAGIPIRMTPDVNVPVQRENVAKTYELIVTDLKETCRLLGATRPQYPTRPYQASAYGALARVFLSMGAYEEAGRYADSCLQLHDELMDFNDFPYGSSSYPFERFNPEVIFYSQITGNGGLTEATARVDTTLVKNFSESDLRKRLFLTEKENGYFAFTGDYGQNTGATKFNGLTTAEILLIRAECFLRNNQLSAAATDVQRLLDHRYTAPRPSVTGKSRDELLDLVLEERRKELLFRGTRWSDIRRFSFESGRQVELVRKLNGETVKLSPEKIQRFAYHIPQLVIDAGQIAQNP